MQKLAALQPIRTCLPASCFTQSCFAGDSCLEGLMHLHMTSVWDMKPWSSIWHVYTAFAFQKVSLETDDCHINMQPQIIVSY